MKPTRKLWQWLGVVFVSSFAALGWLGREIYLAAPPIPNAVVTFDGATLYTGDDVQRGQQAWLAAGGQQLGTVWGHGSYVAPDWSADAGGRLRELALPGIDGGENERSAGNPGGSRLHARGRCASIRCPCGSHGRGRTCCTGGGSAR